MHVVLYPLSGIETETISFKYFNSTWFYTHLVELKLELFNIFLFIQILFYTHLVELKQFVFLIFHMRQVNVLYPLSGIETGRYGQIRTFNT